MIQLIQKQVFLVTLDTKAQMTRIQMLPPQCEEPFTVQVKQNKNIYSKTGYL